MTVHDPLHRERRAHREIGRTEVSRRLAATLSALVLLTAAAVPVAELVRPGGVEAWHQLAAGARRAAGTLLERGPVAANRELLAAMDAFEDRLEEASLVQRHALPPAQWLQTAVLGVGNSEVLVGEEGWLFFLPAVRHLTGPGFLDPGTLARRGTAGDSWETPPQPDPLPALIALDRDLAARGIELLVVPTPVKAALHPDRFTDAASAPLGEPLRNPSWRAFHDRLTAAGIAVHDPSPTLLLAATATGEAQFLATDTHWTPAAVARAAQDLADRITRDRLLPPREATPYRTHPAEATARGDLARLLTLPPASALYPPATVSLERVETPDGRPWTPDPTADLLLLGDSYTNVFSQPALGWGESAGLAEQLARHLRRPVDRIAVNAGGAHASRARLYDLLAHDHPRIAPKRLVVYQFSVRELSHGDWKLFDPETAAPLPAPGARLDPQVASATGAAGPGARPASTRASSTSSQPLGDGYVVWESNRTGDWRIWYQRLDGTGLRQLTPDEPELQHCCPHLAPDGDRLVYLAHATGKDAYPEVEVPGPLRLVELDPASGSVNDVTTLVESARTYGWGDRAAVWRGGSELIYVGGDGRTLLLDLKSGTSRPLTTEPRAELGWLIDPSLRWATNAAPSFSRYDPDARRVIERQVLGGCEPYFSPGGRWGVFMPAGGGPIERIDPETREITTLVRKFDPRMPGKEGYLYFPMVSRDGRVLSFGASAGGHDHFRTDYNIYAAPIDPETLELEGDPVQLTDHPATDRYPDVWLAPLPLGRHAGEAPLTVELPDAGGVADWDYGDGSSERAEAGRHTYSDPGLYEVTARRGGELLRGRVAVAPAEPPRVVAVAPRAAARKLEVSFDEPVRLTPDFSAALESGIAVAGHRLDAGGRRLVLELGSALGGGDTLHLSGVTDRAGRPNPMPPAALEIEPPSWPSDRRALAFLWQTGNQPNEVFDPALRADVADPLTPHGRARLDRYHRMVLENGWFTAPEAAGRRLLEAVERSNEVTLEATVVAAADSEGLTRIVTFSRGPGARNLTLGQQGTELVARVRTGPTGANADRPQVPLFAVEPGRTYHVVVTYSPGRLTAYRDGEQVLESRDVTSGLNRWRPFPLAFGAEPGGDGDWAGTLEGVALYSRVLEPREVRENFLRYRELRRRRDEAGDAGTLVVRAVLDEVSEVPTLRQISPYRRALAVYAWRIERVMEGEPPPDAGDGRLRIAHWVLLDGERTPAAALRPGIARRLVLELFEANPQLEAHYLSETLRDPPKGRLWFSAGD